MGDKSAKGTLTRRADGKSNYRAEVMMSRLLFGKKVVIISTPEGGNSFYEKFIKQDKER